MLTKKERLINEICKNGKLSNYERIIREVIDKTENENCTISCCYHEPRSSCEQSLVDNSKHIRVSLIGKEKPLHIIWDIFHELGHLTSGLKGETDNSLNREEIAWTNAREKIFEYPELINELNDFEYYMNKCLKTYN